MSTDKILSAYKHILYQLVYVLFVLPYDVWCSAINRLAAQRENEALKVSEIKSEWPMFVFLKRWLLDFFYDMMIAIIWFVGLCIFLVGLYDAISSPYHSEIEFLDFLILLLYLYAVYSSVVSIALARDLLVFLLKPFQKFIGWLKKPAQHLDLTIDKELL